MQPVTMLIGGDLVPTKSNYPLFSNGDIAYLIGDEIQALLNSVEFKIFNLEVPLTDIEQPIRKCGPNLIAPVSTINGIKALEPTALCLANNHILDHDEQGLFSTINTLERLNIAFVGAGKNLAEAAKPIYLVKEGIKIGIYACAENEFTIAQENKAGANPFDPLESLDHIQKLKAECEYVIVLYHGGKEHYRYPSPYLHKVCRKIVEKGADLVVCQHSHCIGAYEQFNGKTIVYGQGNFLFDYSESEYWKTSLLLKIAFSDKLLVDYIPICKKGEKISLAVDQEKENILSAFYERSRQIMTPDFIENEYNKFCDAHGEEYLRRFSGFGRIIRKTDRIFKGKFLRAWYTKEQLAVLQNFIECEAHRELVLRYLRGSESR